MSNEKCESPPLTETDEVAKISDSGGGIDSLGENAASSRTSSPDIELADSTLADVATPTPEISYGFFQPFKFPKAVTTDDIVNVDADLIDFDSFKYVNKESLVKAIIYFIKNVDQVNKDLSSVSLSAKADFCCQCEGDKDYVTPNTDKHVPFALPSDTQVDLSNSSQLVHKDCVVSPVIFENSEKVDQIDRRVDDLSKSMSEIKLILSKLMPSETTELISVPNNIVTSHVCAVVPKPTYADTTTSAASNALQVNKVHIPPSNVASSEKSKSSEILLVVPDDNENKTTENMNAVKKMVENKLKDTQVEFVKTNPKSMKVVIGFKSKALRDEGKDKIDSSGTLVNFHYHTKSGSKMLPKIYLPNILEDVLDGVDRSGDSNLTRTREKHAIIEKVLAKNPCVADLHNSGHTLEVVYVNKNAATQHVSIALKVSPAIRLVILSNQEGNLYLGNSRYKIKDRYHVKQCYHCQMIGHISTECPNKNKDATCMYCMGKHRSSTCRSKDNQSNQCCARCLASSLANDAENYKSHNAGDSDCPVMIREIARLKENTELLSKNVM